MTHIRKYIFVINPYRFVQSLESSWLAERKCLWVNVSLIESSFPDLPTGMLSEKIKINISCITDPLVFYPCIQSKPLSLIANNILPLINAFVKTAFERNRKDPLSLKAETLLAGTWEINFFPWISLMKYNIKINPTIRTLHPTFILFEKIQFPRILNATIFLELDTRKNGTTLIYRFNAAL